MNIREDLKAYIDRELPLSRQLIIEDGLKTDEEARREVEFMKLLGMHIKESALESPVVGLEKTLNYLEREERKPRKTTFPVWQTALATACCFVLALVLYPSFAPAREAAKARSAMRAEYNKDKFATAAAPAAGEDQAPVVAAPSVADGDVSGRPQSQGVAGSGGFAPQDSERYKAVPPGDRDFVEGRGRGVFEDTKPVPKLETPVAKPAFDRPLMIRTGNLALDVDSVNVAQGKATSVIEGLGGMVQDTNRTGAEGSQATASMVLRVPESRFSTAMESLKKLGSVTSESSNGQDVTTQVADTEARLKVMRVEEEQYVTLLRGTRRIGEILEVKERLSSVREEIESLDAQRKALRNQASYSTISLSMQEKVKADRPAPAGSWSDDTLGGAQNLLASIGRFLGKLAIYAGVLSPLWVPLLIAGIWMYRRSRR